MRLSKEEKQLIVKLYEIKNYSPEEIAQTMDRGVKTIRNVLTSVGLYENGMWHLSRKRAKQAFARTNPDANWHDFEISRREYFDKAKNDVRNECRKNYNELMKDANMNSSPEEEIALLHVKIAKLERENEMLREKLRICYRLAASIESTTNI